MKEVRLVERFDPESGAVMVFYEDELAPPEINAVSADADNLESVDGEDS